MALEQAKCSNCGGPIGLVGSMYRCEYCKSAYFPPVQCKVNGDGTAGTSTTWSSSSTTQTSSTWSTRSSNSTSGTTWSSSTTTLPMSEEEKRAHWEWMEREQRRIEKENRHRKVEAIAEAVLMWTIVSIAGFCIVLLLNLFAGGH